MPPEDYDKSHFLRSTILNLLWNFSVLQIFVLIVILNFTVFFPKILPESHIFVLDSAEYIDDLYNYGSHPQEVDDNYIREQWFTTETEAV